MDATEKQTEPDNETEGKNPGAAKLTFNGSVDAAGKAAAAEFFDRLLAAEEEGEPERIMANYAENVTFTVDGQRLNAAEIRGHVEEGCKQEGKYQLNYDCHVERGLDYLRCRGLGRQFIDGKETTVAWVSLYLKSEEGRLILMRQDIHTAMETEADWAEELRRIRAGE